MPQSNLVGEFLRARRAQVHPEDVGVPARDGRRVPGLRREEIAMLAGLSSDYYTRLEQGRSRPSQQVTEALARALKLDVPSTKHLHELAQGALEHRSNEGDAPSRHGLQSLLDQWTATPAWVSDRQAQVLAANPLATSLNPSCTPGNNALRALFVQEAAMRDIYVDYDDIAAAAVASLRARNGADLEDRELSELVGRLASESALFERLWSRHHVRFHTEGLDRIRLRHPVVGPMEFNTESMVVNGSAGSVLTVYFADPGGATARKLAELSSIASR